MDSSARDRLLKLMTGSNFGMKRTMPETELAIEAYHKSLRSSGT